MKRPQSIPRTYEERKAYGKSRRDSIAREDQSQWLAINTRKNPVDVILGTCEGRIPEFFAVRIARIAESKFKFFRGSASTMAADLATSQNSGITVQLSGDAHVLNLSAFAAPDGHLLFDFYDFDETCPGPFEWDIKRLATSVVLAAQDSGDSQEKAQEAVMAFVSSYREAMVDFSEMTMIDLSRFEIRRRTQSPIIRAIIGKAEHMTPEVLLEKITIVTDLGERRIADQPSKIFHISDEEARKVLASLPEYRESLPPQRQFVFDAYKPVDVAFGVGGIGSVGTRIYVVLFLGRDSTDALFLQIKEEEKSCLENFLPEAPKFSHHGKRVVEGQRRMQSEGDPFLGWTTIDGRQYMVRQLSDHKTTVNPLELKGETLVEFAHMCGKILAKSHARSGDAAIISGYCGKGAKLDKAIAQFAVAYAKQTENDYNELLKAIKSGRIPSNPNF